MKDIEYHILSRNAYDIETEKEKVKVGRKIEDDKYQVLALENNQKNGMQAMAVV